MDFNKIIDKICKFFDFFIIKADPRRVRIERGHITDGYGNTINFIRFGLTKFHVFGPNLNYRISEAYKDGGIRILMRDGGPTLIASRPNESSTVPQGASILMNKGTFAGLGRISPKWEGLHITKIGMNKYGGVSFECEAIEEEKLIKNLKWVKIDEKSISNNS